MRLSSSFIFPVLILGLFLAFVLQPWRNVVGQDDAYYAIFANSIQRGDWRAPDILLATAWPQVLTGAFFAKLASGAEPLRVYMLTAFAAYLACFGCLCCACTALVIERGLRSWSLLWLAAFFIFPVTLQHGIAFLTEIFVSVLLIAFILLFRSWLKAPRIGTAIGLITLTVLIGLERETYLIFPLGCLIGPWFARSSWSRRWPLFFGVGLAVLVYVLSPKPIFHTAFTHEMIKMWSTGTALSQACIFISRSFQMVLGFGLFLIPFALLIPFRQKILASVLGLHLLFAILIFSFPEDPISAGVLFTSYLPKFVGAIFVSAGVWGLAGISSAFFGLSKWARLVWIVLGAVFVAFTVFLNATDIKYVLPAALATITFILAFGRSTDAFAVLKYRKAIVSIYFVVVGLISCLANGYYLDTLERRKEVAASLERHGADPRLISAGYGRDAYALGTDCFKRIETKLELARPEDRERVQAERVVKVSPRHYEDEAVFQYIVKPAVFMGRQLDLSKNRLQGQSSSPIQILTYRVFGLPNALAIYKNQSPQLAWCYR